MTRYVDTGYYLRDRRGRHWNRLMDLKRSGGDFWCTQVLGRAADAIGGLPWLVALFNASGVACWLTLDEGPHQHIEVTIETAYDRGKVEKMIDLLTMLTERLHWKEMSIRRQRARDEAGDWMDHWCLTPEMIKAHRSPNPRWRRF